ncbi:MAG: hypothetical protein AAF517_09350 [Planctomycetota bacterium]
MAQEDSFSQGAGTAVLFERTVSLGAQLGDFDGDGTLDVIAGHDGEGLSLALRSGEDWATPAFLPTSVTRYLVRSADEGADDVIVWNDDGVSLVRLDGTNLSNTRVIEATPIEPRQILSIDADGDGDRDLALVGRDRTSIHRSVAGSYDARPLTTWDHPHPAYNAAAADMDADGFGEIVLGTTNGVHFLSEESGRFPPLATEHASTVSAADFNLDGLVDVAALRLETAELAVYLATGVGEFADDPDVRPAKPYRSETTPSHPTVVHESTGPSVRPPSGSRLFYVLSYAHPGPADIRYAHAAAPSDFVDSRLQGDELQWVHSSVTSRFVHVLRSAERGRVDATTEPVVDSWDRGERPVAVKTLAARAKDRDLLVTVGANTIGVAHAVDFLGRGLEHQRIATLDSEEVLDAIAYDFDGDDHDELVVSVGAPNPSLIYFDLTASSSAPPEHVTTLDAPAVDLAVLPGEGETPASLVLAYGRDGDRVELHRTPYSPSPREPERLEGSAQSVFVVDFDGDGTDDLVTADEEGAKVFRREGDSWQSAKLWEQSGIEELALARLEPNEHWDLALRTEDEVHVVLDVETESPQLDRRPIVASEIRVVDSNRNGTDELVVSADETIARITADRATTDWRYVSAYGISATVFDANLDGSLDLVSALGRVVAVIFSQGVVPQFVRGDVDSNERQEISDVVHLLRGLFLGGQAPDCPDAADLDDDGRILITDAMFMLNYIFREGTPPPTPTISCGIDPTPDDLDQCIAACR